MALELKTSPRSLRTEIVEEDYHRPGLALSGFTEVYSNQRVQIVGTSEWTYLESLGRVRRGRVFKALESFKAPMWILTHGFPVHPELLELCQRQKVPVFVTTMTTMEFCTQLQHILQDWFSPYCSVHGTLVDVYGVGMLYTGRSGVGKSECALDLVERGHRLVADDIVNLVKSGHTIIGKGNPSLGHHMEIRGVGIVDVGKLFGIRAIRDKKKVEIIVELQHWKSGATYDRTGLEELSWNVMEIDIPRKIIPISPGKNITVISEVIAMNMLLKMNGIDVAKLFNEKLINIMRKKRGAKGSEILSTEVYE